MEAEVVHHAGLAAEFVLALPVDRLGRIEIAGVEERTPHFEEAAEGAAAGQLKRALGAGEKRELRRDADEAAELGGFIADAAGGREVDAERLLGEEIFAGAEHVEVERFVDMVRHGDVNGVDVGPGEEHAVIGVEMADRRDLAEPVEGGGVDVTDRDELGAHRTIKEGEPTPKGGGDLAAHEAGADDGDADGGGGCWGGGGGRGAHARNFRASAGVAPSWTTAMRARVIAAGFGCWMILRP